MADNGGGEIDWVEGHINVEHGAVAQLGSAQDFGGEVPPPIYQRIYDTGLGQYVYFTKTTVDTAPAPGETSPNHSGSLDAARHEIL